MGRRRLPGALLRRCTSFLLASLTFLTTLSGGPLLAIDTVWNFGGDLSATSGTSTLSYRGDTSTVTQFGTPGSFGLPSLPGATGTEQIMAFPAASPTQGYTVTHNGDPLEEEYTMIWDILFPESSDVAWRSLMQTSETNANDGDFFVRDVPWGGVGISGQYHGVIKPDEWNRVAVTRDASGTWHKYINGGYVGEQDASSSRFSLGPTFHLFADESNDTEAGYVSSFRYVDSAMTASEILQLGGPHAAGTATSGQTLPDPSYVEPGSFTIAVLGDTQNYSQFYPDIYEMQTQWLVDNKAQHNLQFVLHVGDVVNFNSTTQWDNAATAQSTLDGELNYAISPGNHDYADNRAVTQFNQVNRFGPGSAYDGQSTLSGHYPAEPNSRTNTYHTFQANGQDYLVLALEFGPRDEVVAWAQSVADAHPYHRAILLTHAYMFDGGQWFDATVDPNDPQGRTYDQIRDAEVNHAESIFNPKSYGWAADGNDGKDLWDKLVKERENMSLVITGHQFDEFDGFPYLLTQNENGDDIYQMLVDMQNRLNGGDGWIRLLEFSPDGQTVTVKSYSPFLDEWSYASDEFFTVQLSPVHLKGDFDKDGDVDGDDFLLWQRGGSPNSFSVSDLNEWKMYYGDERLSLVANQATVPEPTSFILLTCFVGVWYGRSRLRYCK